MSAVLTPDTMRGTIAAELTEARERTWLLVGHLGDEDLRQQHDPLMSPLLWDLGHIAHFEALWLTRNLDGPIQFIEMPGLFNPMEHPRATRAGLPLPSGAECRALMAGIREQVLARLAEADFDGSPLVREGFVYRMVLQHEFQHNETMLQTLQLKQGAPYRPAMRRPSPAPQAAPAGMVEFPGGEVSIGTDDRAAAYDNERPRHAVSLAPFRIDVTPVTNGAYREFVEQGGYRRREFWSPAGWAWLVQAGVSAPQFWERRGSEWWSRTMDRTTAIDPARPVCHVSYYEAEAYACFAGKRLPSELEWETAASWDRSGPPRRYPWGDEHPTAALANIDQLSFGTTPVGSYPRNVSPLGCHGLIGDVWEWTSSDFTGYTGFQAFPYPEYSEAFFGSEYKVLRGGSWATRPGAIRNTFRNWDYPIRRQIFSGFRCAADV